MSDTTVNTSRMRNEGLAAGTLNKIDTVLGEITGLLDQVASLNQLLKELQAEKPELGSLEGLDEEEANRRRATFEREMSAWTRKIENCCGQIARCQENLEKCNEKLNQLNNVELPANKRKDVEEAERRMKQEKEQLESSIQELDNSDEDLNSSAAAARAEIRAREVNGRLVLEVTYPPQPPGSATTSALGSAPPPPGSGIPTNLP